MNKRPQYEQVMYIIKEKIINGEWYPGYKFPTEAILSKQLGVSRTTLRESLRILTEMELIEVKNGIGTFVKKRSGLIQNPLSTLNSVGDMINLCGYKDGAYTFNVSHTTPDDFIKHKLDLNKNELIVAVKRKRTANGKPVAYAVNIFPEKICGNIFDEGIEGRIFDILKDKCNIEVSYALTKIKAVNLSKEYDKEAIKILGNEIVLLEQLHYDNKDVPVLFSYDYLNTNIMSLKINRKR